MGRKKKQAMLTADGYSIHTIEMKVHMTCSEWMNAVHTAFSRASQTGTQTYEIARGTYCCTSASKDGVRLYLTKYDREGNVRPQVKAVINPRRLIDPQSSYLGILPTDEKSMQCVHDRFADLMRWFELPEFMEDWTLSRADLCVNLICPKSKIARELIRTARKWPAPPKYKRLYLENKHKIHFRTGTVDLVLYDKTYQMGQEGLLVQEEKLPDGVLRIEVQYRREYVRRQAKKFGTQDDAWATLRHLTMQSKTLMLRHIERCFPAGDFCKPMLLAEKIETSDLPSEMKARMVILTEALRKRPTVDHAVEAMKLTRKEAKEVLAAFEKIGLSPIPLRKGFYRDQMLSIPHILHQIEDDGSSTVVVEEL